MKLYDFTDVKLSNRVYGGLSGTKLGIIFNNDYWLLKFPRSTKSFKDVYISYTTSPLSEYLGSQIYQLLGVDVHETLLGIREDKIVVACKDFMNEDEKYYEFCQLSNQLQDLIKVDTFYGCDIQDLIIVIENNPFLITSSELRDRICSMFLIDAFIGNDDRNNGNWGFIIDKSNIKTLAPVYDNGACFNCKLSDEEIRTIMNDSKSFEDCVYYSLICNVYENEKKINPLMYMESMCNEELNKAVISIVPKIDLKKIHDIIYDLPNSFKNVDIISDIKKEFYYKTLVYRYEKILLPIYERLIVENGG